MFFYNLKMVSFFTLVISVILGFSFNNIFSLWLALEVNLISFVGFISLNSVKQSAESTVKYFVVQAFSSGFFFFGIVISSFLMLSSFSSFWMSVPLLVKLGMAPFHSWFIDLSGQISWLNLFLLSSIQKLLPFVILNKIFMLSPLIWVLISIVVASLGSLSQVWVKKFLGYSSVFSSAWLYSALNNMESFLIFWSLYCLALGAVLIPLKENQLLAFNQLKMNKFSWKMKSSLFFPLLSMAGIPPMIGFLGKFVVIQDLLIMNLFFLSFVLVQSAIILFMIYTKMLVTFFLKTSVKPVFSSLSLFNSWVLIIISPLIVYFWIYMFSCEAQKNLNF